MSADCQLPKIHICVDVGVLLVSGVLTLTLTLTPFIGPMKIERYFFTNYTPLTMEVQK